MAPSSDPSEIEQEHEEESNRPEEEEEAQVREAKPPDYSACSNDELARLIQKRAKHNMCCKHMPETHPKKIAEGLSVFSGCV